MTNRTIINYREQAKAEHEKYGKLVLTPLMDDLLFKLLCGFEGPLPDENWYRVNAGYPPIYKPVQELDYQI